MTQNQEDHIANRRQERSHEAYLEEARDFFTKIDREYEILTVMIPANLIGAILSLEHMYIKTIPETRQIAITRRTAREICCLVHLKERYVNGEDRRKIQELNGVMREAINDPLPDSVMMQLTGGDPWFKRP